ncbi:MAG: hypothetical protein IJC04_09350 [Oscillospiraceae bacterium]|nr:hypothetical protein [Oscillospiraceae bacterium]
MKDYYDRNYKAIKSRSYLIWGLIMASLTLIMIVVSVLSMVHDAALIQIVTGFAAAAAWAVASLACLNVYYRDNRIEIKEKAIEIAETVENAVKK